MGQAEQPEHSSFASRYFKLDALNVQPALETGNAYFNDRPILTTFSVIFFGLSMLPVLVFLGIFLFTSVLVFVIALVVAFFTSSAVFLGLFGILASILLGAFCASVFFTLVATSGYFFFRLIDLVQEGGVSGVSAWACELKSHILKNIRQAQPDTNGSVVVVEESRSSDHIDENYYDVKVQAAD